MPLAALVCYCRSCKGDKTQDVDTVLEHAAKRDNPRYTYELLKAMLAEVQDRGTRISTTTVLSGKCLRSEVLKRSIPYADDPKKMYASFRGTMFHGRLELNAHPDSIPEARFHKHLEGLGWFSGSPDLLDPGAGYLYDYKFTKQNPVFDYPWKDHREQMQVNRWLVDTCDWVEHGGETYPLTEVGCMALGEDYDKGKCEAAARKFRPVDWQGLVVVYMDDAGPKPILVSKSIEVPQKGDPEKTKRVRVADIWEDDRVRDLVHDNYLKAQEAFDLMDEGVLPDIPPDYTAWKHPLCGFCPVKEECVDAFIEEEVAIRTSA